MPELPEVETIVRKLQEPLAGRTLLGANFPGKTGRMMNISPEEMAARTAGQAVVSLTRRAKYLLFQLSSDMLVVHLKMTGYLYITPADEQNHYDRWMRVKFPLDNGQELRFSDSRRFGRVYLCANPAEVLPELGPEPLEESFTLDVFKKQLAGRSSVLKSLLLDQAFVAGVGNIYADEALHIARLHPLRKADSLNGAEIERLHCAIREALEDGVRYRGASIGWYRMPDGTQGESQEHLRVYRTRATKDHPCPDCGGPISVIRVGSRSTHFCPTCQTR